MYAFCGHFLMTLLLSAFFYVVVEMPFTRLGSMLLRTRPFRKTLGSPPRNGHTSNGTAAAADTVKPISVDNFGGIDRTVRAVGVVSKECYRQEDNPKDAKNGVYARQHYSSQL